MRYLAIIAACLLAAGARGQGQWDGSTQDATVSGTTPAPTGTMTITAWVYHHANSGRDCIAAKWDGVTSSDDSWIFSIESSGKGRFYIVNAASPGTLKLAETPSAISLNEWHFMAGMYDGANVKVYVDGDLTVGNAYTGAILANASQDIDIANASGGSSQYFDGMMDKVRIYTTALTTNELASLILDQCDKFKPELATNTALTAIRDPAFDTDHSNTNCAASYDTKFLPFSDGAAVTGTWHDATGNGNDATIYNSPTREAAR